MDISNISDGDSSEFHPSHPVSGEKFDCAFMLAGMEHPQRRALVNRINRDLRKRVNRYGKLRIEEDPELDYERDTDFLVACILGWRDLDYKGQSPYPYNAANCRALLLDSERQWLRRQIQEALNEQELFIRSSSGA